MPDSIKFWLTYVILVTVVLAIGWNQPIRYRFMSKEEIAALNAPAAAPQPGEWMWKGDRSSKLDRGAYGRRTGSGTTSGYTLYPR